MKASLDILGTLIWHDDTGRQHNERGPAIVFADGTMIWKICGKIHRADGPAIVHADGDKEWWSDSKRHRDIGHACVSYERLARHERVMLESWHDGYRHEIDRPAVIASSTHEWWIDGFRLRIS